MYGDGGAFTTPCLSQEGVGCGFAPKGYAIGVDWRAVGEDEKAAIRQTVWGGTVKKLECRHEG